MKNTQLDRLYQIYPVLEIINQKNKGIIVDNIVFRTVEAGEFIQTGDCQCSDLFFVLQGSLKIEKIDENGKVMRMYTLEPGDMCHEVLGCYLSCEPLHLTGVAVTDMEVGYIPIRSIESVLINDVDMLKFFYMNLYRKFRKVVLDKEEMMNESIADRLKRYIVSKNSKNIYMTHQEIAIELGTAREVISRNLKMLEKQGLIQLERNKIINIGLSDIE